MNSYYLRYRYIILLLTTILLLIISFNTVSNIANSIEKKSDITTNDIQTEKKLEFISIPQGSSASEISSILDNEGIISSSIAFEIYLRNENLSDKLRAGDYEIFTGLEFEEITNILLKGPPLKTYTITIPEGLWISETLESISSQTGYEVSSLTNSLISGTITSNYLYLNDPSKLEHWEGLLFPNTYQIDVNSTGDEVLQILVNQLEIVIDTLFEDKELPYWVNNYRELLTIASLVEAESKIDEDRPLVASVIKNRLYDEMLLQIDATVLYALQKRKNQVLLIDLQIDSKYNTYKYVGLPPTPISGFGERSIKAVIDAPESDFIYYLLTNKNGKMSFTNDYSEFINMKNKAKEEGVIP